MDIWNLVEVCGLCAEHSQQEAHIGCPQVAQNPGQKYKIHHENWK